ncbi:HIT family protein [Litorivivens sp.]|uniref:HIT family protein n=1 Tax=Litorivivens sp. TaxID=2020868 RepID=UPI003562DC8F
MATIFSRIIAGELPGHFIWRDEQAVAIMTIAPICAGHVLVIPVEEIDHWDDMPQALANHCLSVARAISKAQKAVYDCQRVSLQIVGLEVPHTHLHLVPINRMEDANFANAAPADGQDLAREAERLRAELGTQGL